MQKYVQPLDRQTRSLVIRDLKPIVASSKVLTRKQRSFLKGLLYVTGPTDVTFGYITDYLVDSCAVTQEEINALIKKHNERPE